VIDENGVPLLQALRSTLGAGEAIIGPDGFTPFPALLEAGRAAEGVTVSVAENPTNRLDRTGKQFATSFAAAVGASTEPYSVAAAQATDNLVAAIAHSNGTRKSVLSELHALPTIGGVLGDFRFDRNGDTTAGVVTIYRIHHGRPVIWRIIRPPSK
jgi:ABC-type branched-subunit amino acid transport system substrate-binding protein